MNIPLTIHFLNRVDYTNPVVGIFTIVITILLIAAMIIASINE